jgi:hypothetical protein
MALTQESKSDDVGGGGVARLPDWIVQVSIPWVYLLRYNIIIAFWRNEYNSDSLSATSSSTHVLK